MPNILGANSVTDTGYDVANSVRMNAADSAKMTIDFSSAGNQQIFTISCWVKRATITPDNSQTILSNYADVNNFCNFTLSTTDKLSFVNRDGGTFNVNVATTKLFRDPSAWYHLMVAVDTTQGTASNRVKLYVNGTQETSLSSTTYPNQNTNLKFNTTATTNFGSWSGSAQYADGHYAELVFIDGQQLTPSSFGEFNSDSPNIWQPIDVSDLTFGTNGFYLDFEDSSNLGNDVNGGTDLTEVNLAATDQSTDTCTNNFATLNPLHFQSRNSTHSEANLKVTSADSDAWDTHYGISTIAVSSGKWYVEAKVTTTTTSQNILGIISTSQFISSSLKDNGVAAVERNGRITGGGNNIETGLTAFSNGDIAAVAFDADNGTAQFYRNGSTYGSAVSSIASDTYYFATTTYDVGGVVEFNFGSPPFSISTGNADDNGYGNFEYDVPDGYYALNTKNLAEHG